VSESRQLPFRFVDKPEALEEAARSLAGKDQLFVDTEFESTRERTRLCLLQVSDGATAYLIDAIAMPRLGALRAAFEAAEWVLHAGQQDVPLICGALGITAPERAFDTQIAWAMTSAEANVSLAYLKFQLLGSRDGKAHQADDWTRRPLSQSQLKYAADDVLGLPDLVHQVSARAAKIAPARLQQIRSASLESLTWAKDPPLPLDLDSFRNAWQLGPASQAGLRFLIDWYNGLSPEDRAEAPEAKALLTIASRMPTERESLLELKGIPRGFAQRHHKRLLEGLADAARGARASDFVQIDPPPYATFPDIAREAWLGVFRASSCARLVVSPEFVLPARITKRLAATLATLEPTASPAQVSHALTETLTGFRRDLLESALVDYCHTSPPPLGHSDAADHL
jgi:ribonuclease D